MTVLRALLCALGLGLALGGCDERGSQGPIRFALANGPVTLDPRFATDAASSRINRLLYARLVDFDASLQPVPALAAWEALSPTRYRFTLLPGRGAFPGGRAPDAADVKATYDDVLDPARGSPHRAALAHIRAITTPAEDTVEFELSKPDVLFPSKLVIGVLPAALIAAGHPFNTRPVGSGPFAFEAWPSEGRLVLERRRDGQVVEFVEVSEPNTRVLKLLEGEVDLLQGDLAPEIVTWLGERDDAVVARAAGSRFVYLGFNLEDPVVGRLEIRQAIAHALDRDAIIEHVMGNAARPAASILPPSHWAGHPGLESPAHDPARARRLLRQAGYPPGEGPRLVYKTSAAPFRVRLATIIQDQLSRAGFRVEVHSHDWGTFYADVKAGRFQMYSLAWVGIKTPDIFRYVFHSEAVPPGGANRGRFRSARADALIERAERAPTLERQAALYRALQALVLERLPYVPLWYEDNVAVTVPSLRGYALRPDGNYDGLLAVHRQ